MKAIDFTELLPDAVLRCERDLNRIRVPLFLTLPPNLPSFYWNDSSLEDLIFTLIARAISSSHPERPIRLSVGLWTRMSDIEAMLKIHPSCWIQLRIDLQPVSDFGPNLQDRLKDLNYRPVDDWITEDSRGQLIAYSHAVRQEFPLLFWIRRRKSNHRYAFLIPIEKPAA
jgi:hypothetical protein